MRREKPLVQAVEFFENTGPMGCHFIFPESDFDPSNSIGSRNMSVLTSTRIGLAAENSSNRFSILLSTLFPVATGHNRNNAKSQKSRFWRQKKFSGFYSFFVCVRQNSILEFGVQISNLSFYFHILYAQLRCSQKYANASGACCSNKTIICKFPSDLKWILLKVGAQSTREIERRSCETRKWASSNLCKFFISAQETAEKISQIIFITTR